MFIPIPVLIVAIVVGLAIFMLTRSGRRERDPLEDVGDSYRRTTGSAPLPSTPEDIEAQARLLLARHKKIEAIKLVRESTGMALKDAKDYVERL